MPVLPDSVREKFTAVLAKRLPITEFEQWVYATSELETALPADDYLELISFNYKSRDALRELTPLLEPHVLWQAALRDELLCIQQTVENRSKDDRAQFMIWEAVSLPMIAQILQMVLDGQSSREAAAEWAAQVSYKLEVNLFTYKPIEAKRHIWDALYFIRSIDLQDSPGSYL